MKFLKLKKNKKENETESFSVKENYLEVVNDFKISDLKPYQRLIILKDKGIHKTYLIDFALSKSEIDRLNEKDIQLRSDELKTDKPFRMISQNDIDLGQGKNSYEFMVSANDESIILDNVNNINPFLNNNPNSNPDSKLNFDSNLNLSKFTVENYNKNEKRLLKFRNNKNKANDHINDKSLVNDETSDIEDNIDNEISETNFEVIENQDAINLEMKEKYKKKLIFDDNVPIELYEGEKRTVILPFKLREVNDEWKKNDVSFFRSAPKGAHKWFANNIEESFLKSLEDSYNGSLSSPFAETYEPISIVDFGPDDLIDQNIISSIDNQIFYTDGTNTSHEAHSNIIESFSTPNDVVNEFSDSTINDEILPSHNDYSDKEIDNIPVNDNVLPNSNDIQYFNIDDNYNNNELSFKKNDNEQEKFNILNNEIEVDFNENMLESSFVHNENYDENTNYDDTSFFKKEVNLKTHNEIININKKPNKNIHSKFGKEFKNSKYEKIKLPKLNNMIIVRKRIDKKLIKERAQN